MDLQSTFRELGGFGIYQTLVCIAGNIGSCFAGLLITGGAFQNLVACNSDPLFNDTIVAKNGSIASHNKHQFRTSVSIEYGLCDELASLGELSSVFLMAGCIPGSLLAGLAADTFGRVAGSLMGLVGATSMNILAIFAPYFWLHLASRLVCGFFISWTVESIFVYGNEVLLTEYRSRFAKIYYLGSNGSCALVALLAYVLRDYKKLMMSSTFASIIAILIMVVVPESPSWLMSQKNKSPEELKRALNRIALINRRPAPDTVAELNKLQKAFDSERSKSRQLGKEAEAENFAGLRKKTGGSLWTAMKILLSSRASVKILLTTCLYSFSGGLSYYGFTYVIARAVPNIYITIALMGCVEPPSLLLLNTLSRSRTLFFCALGTVILSLAIGVIFWFVDLKDFTLGISIIMVCLAVGGKFTSNIAFCAIMTVGAEIYPTAARNTGLGLQMAVLRIGSMLSPMVNFIPFMPARFAVLGLTCLLAAFPARSLPDTRVKDLTSSCTATAELQNGSTKLYEISMNKV